MPAPLGITPYVRPFANPVMVNLAGHGWFVELEHIGRTSGTAYRTPLLAFRHGDTITIALTYGPGVQWLKNLRAAGGGRMHWRDSMLYLGPPRPLATEDGMEQQESDQHDGKLRSSGKVTEVADRLPALLSP